MVQRKGLTLRKEQEANFDQDIDELTNVTFMDEKQKQQKAGELWDAYKRNKQILRAHLEAQKKDND